MKNKKALKVPLLLALLLFGVGVMGFVYFGYHYYQNTKKLEILNTEIEGLIAKNQELEKYGEWTLDYFKIDKALTKMAEDKISKETRIKLTEKIWQISGLYDIDPLLILAIVSQESRGNPTIRGRYQSGAESGAYGLMQLKMETAASLGKKFGIILESEEDLMRPEVNVVLGTAYLMRLIGRYQGNVKAALIAYNIGHGKVDRLLASGKDLPTKYYEGIISRYRTLVSDSIFLDFTR